MSRDRSDPSTPAGYVVTNTGGAWAGAPGSVAVSGYVQGDVIVGLPRYRLTALASGPPRPAETLRLAELLDARHRVVPFLGREDEQRSLRRWLGSPYIRGDREVRLIHAPGGQGKTRLADQFAETAREAGWEVLRAHRDPGASDPAPAGDPHRTDHGMLVLVDYGDRWPAGDLRALFTDPRLHRGGPVRVLVLARSLGYWWQTLRHWLRTLGMSTQERELPPLAPDRADRERLFRAAATRFAALVPHVRTDAVRVPDLADPAYGTALTLQLAALVAVAASRHPGAPTPSTLVDMYGYLLDREVGHWQQLLAGAAVTSRPEQLDRAVLAATLAGPVPYDVAQAILGSVGAGTGSAGLAELLADHATCYPPRDAGSMLEPLQPDRLGEAYLALALPGHGWSSHPPRPWAVGTVRTLLRGDGMPTATAAQVRASTLTVLAEVAASWQHVASGVLLPALRDDPTLATAAGGAVLARIVDLPSVDVGLLARIEPVLPSRRHVDFDNVARDVMARLVSDRLSRDLDPVERARSHIAYGRRLANAGDREAALEQADLAVAAGEAALASRPAAQTSALLAQALHVRGHRLAAVNRYSAALASVERAVKLLSPLAEDRGVDAESYRSTFAETLDNLALRLSHTYRHEQAEVVARRAVSLFTGGPGSTVEDVGLAGALTNLAVIEAHLGRGGEALSTVRRAEQIWRRLSEDEPSVYRPELALALNTVGLRHAELGQLTAAVAIAEESVGIYRDLVRANAVAFELDLAAVLANLSGYLWQLGRRAEAFQLNAEAEEIFARWGGANPQAFSKHLRHLRENIAAMRAQQSPADLRRWELGAGSFNS
ncbi:tetratricopeptide repeat protein [Micromonospora halophytica]|uniref:Tetratricopeptide repeat-containing protein n=1 Tax=Micromonospora halophytica TaxID=47864 RepID=A0A1C5I9A3_9ACTN|nr:tetratricopeptide repeat protein [Micromonospora halophytica]SCG54844.1 Tetratricopeptide repeat-containing protein [Micromonospora halophytica]